MHISLIFKAYWVVGKLVVAIEQQVVVRHLSCTKAKVRDMAELLVESMAAALIHTCLDSVGLAHTEQFWLTPFVSCANVYLLNVFISCDEQLYRHLCST